MEEIQIILVSEYEAMYTKYMALYFTKIEFKKRGVLK